MELTQTDIPEFACLSDGFETKQLISEDVLNRVVQFTTSDSPIDRTQFAYPHERVKYLFLPIQPLIGIEDLTFDLNSVYAIVFVDPGLTVATGIVAHHIFG